MRNKNPLKQNSLRKALSSNPENVNEEEQDMTPQKQARQYATQGKETKARGAFDMFTNIQPQGDILRLISGKSKKDSPQQNVERSLLTMIEDSYNKIISGESDSVEDKKQKMLDLQAEDHMGNQNGQKFNMKTQSLQKDSKKVDANIIFSSMSKPRYEFNPSNINIFAQEVNLNEIE